MRARRLIRAGILAALALVAAVALRAVLGYERIIAEGRVVLVELAPVDPRSLMQGDYMALRFAIDAALPALAGATSAPPRFAHVAVDAAGRARLLGVAPAPPIGAEVVGMRIRRRDGHYSIGPNAFFFQEGRAADFSAARWGEFRVAADGSALLTHLRDETLQRLGAQRR